MKTSSKTLFLLSLFSLLGINLTVYSQTVLYSEDFSNDAGNGYANDVLTDPTDNNWTLSLIGTPDVDDNNDHCKVTSGYLQWRDNNCGVGDYIDFTSAEIAGAYSNVSVSLDYYVYDAYCSGIDANLTFYYKIDGGSWVQFGSQTSTGGGISGTEIETGLAFASTFQIRVRGNTPTCSQAVAYIDNISITDIPTNLILPSGNSTYTSCSGSVYDFGGSGGDYGDDYDGSLTIYPSTPGNLVNIAGTISTEAGFDYFYVYDGENTSATLLATLDGTGQSVNYTSTHATGALTVRLTSDGSVNESGVDIAVSCISLCEAPSALTSSLVTANSATISWTAPSSAPSDGYEYYLSTLSTDPTSGTPATDITGAGVVSAGLSSLSSGTTYYYWVRSNCGSGDLSDWTASSTFTTLEAVPTITSFTPSDGCPSIAEVVVTGTNFGGVTVMTIGGTAVTSFNVDSDTQITATVGSGSDGVIYVQNTAGNASSSSSFTFTAGSASISTQPDATLDIVAGNSDVISVVASSVSSYQWQYSEDNTVWSNIVDGTPANVTYSGATTANLTIQPNTSVVGATAYYKCILQCGNVSSNSAAITFVQYCDQTGGTDSGVVGVTFGTIDNTTSNPYDEPYSDYYPDYEESVL